MIIEKLSLGIMKNNCYLVYNENTKNAVVIDPCVFPDRIYNEIKMLGLNVKMVCLTHGHYDHMLGAEKILEYTGAPLAVHPLDERCLADKEYNLNYEKHYGKIDLKADILLNEGDEIDLDGEKLLVMHTPGHSPGSICFYTEGSLISGDVLFNRSVGRTDFIGGSTEELMKSIKEKLYTLPENTVVYPGHGENTTILEERKENPFVNELY